MRIGIGSCFIGLVLGLMWVGIAVAAPPEAYGACLLACDEQNVDFQNGMVGPGADLEGMRHQARQRYALCLYHCDPSLEYRPTLLRLFPPLGRLSETNRGALSTDDQLMLCVQDCDTSRRACEEANFGNAQICRSGGRACRARCDEAFSLGQGDSSE